jgi:hypothetical protein
VRELRGPGLASVAGLFLIGCSSGQAAAPSPPDTNAPPVIHALLKNTDRAEVGGTIELAVDVDDRETSKDALAYEWAVSGGTIIGSGFRVQWRAPVSATPSSQEIALTVLERYTIRDGRPILSAENTATASTRVYVNNTPAELQTLAYTFIDDFIHSERLPAYCVRNFSDSCRGKGEEFSDIVNNRLQFVIDTAASSFTLRSISYFTPGNVPDQTTFATVRLNCHFVSTNRVTGVTGPADGICRLNNVYENHQWQLCDSLFDPPAGVSTAFIF